MRRAAQFVLVLIGVLALLGLGGGAIVYGGADDSPGLQGIGVLVVIGAAAAALRWRGGGSRVRRPARRARCGSAR